MDARPEVRNSGVRTLFSVVVSQGGRLSPEQWRHVWWTMCFPLLRTVHHTSTTSNREEVRATPPFPSPRPEGFFHLIVERQRTVSLPLRVASTPDVGSRHFRDTCSHVRSYQRSISDRSVKNKPVAGLVAASILVVGDVRRLRRRCWGSCGGSR